MTYAALACNQAGFSYLIKPLTADGLTVTVTEAAKQLPVLQDGQFFYAVLKSACGDCEQVRVTGTSGNVLTIARTGAGCFPIGATLEYDHSSPQAINAMVVGRITGASEPLQYDPDTGTISLDITALKIALGLTVA